jgi:hypothetical protein
MEANGTHYLLQANGISLAGNINTIQEKNIQTETGSGLISRHNNKMI